MYRVLLKSELLQHADRNGTASDVGWCATVRRACVVITSLETVWSARLALLRQRVPNVRVQHLCVFTTPLHLEL